MCAKRPADYFTFEGLPGWAQQTLSAHVPDPRPFLYDRETFERGDTHDPIWNAAQREMLRDGWMHNYMRMLWGKKILEWSATPQDALETMIALMDRGRWTAVIRTRSRLHVDPGQIRPSLAGASDLRHRPVDEFAELCEKSSRVEVCVWRRIGFRIEERLERDQGSGIRDQGSGIRDQGSGSGIGDQGSGSGIGIRDRGSAEGSELECATTDGMDTPRVEVTIARGGNRKELAGGLGAERRTRGRT